MIFKNNRTVNRASSLLATTFLYASLGLLPAFAMGQPIHEPTATHAIFQWRPFLAPFHAVVLHFPIGFVTMAFVLEVYGMRRPDPVLKRVASLTLWLSLLSGLVTAGFGILRAASGGYERHTVETHRWTGIAVVACTLATLAVHKLACRDERRRALTYGYRALLVMTLGLLVVAGHVGGNLTHGSKYLTENAPAFVREFLEDVMPEPTDPTVPDILGKGQSFFVEKVQPILNNKCIRCHGPEKQKGEYRMDQPEVAIKGGESGKAAIKPGKPMESELVRLITLPPEDEDAMPPKGKEPLSADEMLTFIRWIQMGAEFPSTARPAGDGN